MEEHVFNINGTDHLLMERTTETDYSRRSLKSAVFAVNGILKTEKPSSSFLSDQVSFSFFIPLNKVHKFQELHDKATD